MKQAVTPVILSGGAGTRLWPLSRHLRPKQFMQVHGDASMFAQTLARVAAAPCGAPVVVCNDAHRFLVAEELRRLDIAARDIILEPVARNTGPAIAAAAVRLLETKPDSDPLMLVMSSDHVMDDELGFRRDIEAAARLAGGGRLVAFGVAPTRPETGYGYILRGDALGDDGWRVERFVEKPDAQTAARYIADGGYLWNAGIFLFGARTFLDELAAFRPDMLSAARAAVDGAAADLDFLRLRKAAFETAPAVSVDHAVMEETAKAAVVPLHSSWNDVGSWASLWEIGDADDAGNVVTGDAALLDVRDSYVRSEKPLVAALGVEGLVIVATDDVVAVLPKDRAQDVKDLVAAVAASGRDETNSHSRVYRPWGHYQNLERGDGFLVKRIVVNPGAKLSLQYHHHRAEHWIVVAGTARVTNGDETFELAPNQSTYIALGARHRLENPGDEPLALIEVQSGDYIGEDDIVRLEDTYGRG